MAAVGVWTRRARGGAADHYWSGRPRVRAARSPHSAASVCQCRPRLSLALARPARGNEARELGVPPRRPRGASPARSARQSRGRDSAPPPRLLRGRRPRRRESLRPARRLRGPVPALTTSAAANRDCPRHSLGEARGPLRTGRLVSAALRRRRRRRDPGRPLRYRRGRGPRPRRSPPRPTSPPPRPRPRPSPRPRRPRPPADGSAHDLNHKRMDLDRLDASTRDHTFVTMATDVPLLLSLHTASDTRASDRLLRDACL